jgi:hypothetical protein
MQTPLESTLMDLPISVENKGLAGTVISLESTLTKKQGG